MDRFKKNNSKFYLGTKYSLRSISRITYLSIILVFITLSASLIMNLSIFSNEIVNIRTQELEPSFYEISNTNISLTNIEMIMTKINNEFKKDISLSTELKISWRIDTLLMYNQSKFIDATIYSDNDPLLNSFGFNILVNEKLKDTNFDNTKVIFNNSLSSISLENATFINSSNILRFRKLSSIIIPISELISPLDDIKITKLYLSFTSSIPKESNLNNQEIDEIISSSKIIQEKLSLVLGNQINIISLFELQYSLINDVLKEQIALTQVEFFFSIIILFILYIFLIQIDLQKERRNIKILKSQGIAFWEIVKFYIGKISISFICSLLLSIILGEEFIPIITHGIFGVTIGINKITFYLISIGLAIIYLLSYIFAIVRNVKLRNLKFSVPKQISTFSFIQILVILIFLPIAIQPLFFYFLPVGKTGIFTFGILSFTIPSIIAILLFILVITITHNINKIKHNSLKISNLGLGIRFYLRKQQKNLFLLIVFSILLINIVNVMYLSNSIQTSIPQQAREEIGADITGHFPINLLNNISDLESSSLYFSTFNIIQVDQHSVDISNILLSFINFTKFRQTLYHDSIDMELNKKINEIEENNSSLDGLIIAENLELNSITIFDGANQTNINLEIQSISKIPGLFTGQQIILLDVNKFKNLFELGGIADTYTWVNLQGSNKNLQITTIRSILNDNNIEYMYIEDYVNVLSDLYDQIILLSATLIVFSLSTLLITLFFYIMIEKDNRQINNTIMKQLGINRNRIKKIYWLEFVITYFLSVFVSIIYFAINSKLDELNLINGYSTPEFFELMKFSIPLIFVGIGSIIPYIYRRHEI